MVKARRTSREDAEQHLDGRKKGVQGPQRLLSWSGDFRQEISWQENMKYVLEKFINRLGYLT